MSVDVIRVSRSYGQQLALNQVSFALKRGEITGFIGPNGAGKSTMMKIITGFLKPDEGSVTIEGLNPEKEPLEVRKQLGYLPEHNPLYLHMYVEEYLDFTAGLYGLKKGRAARVSEVIHLTGLEPEKHKQIGALSKGFRQRVGLAQAIVHDPGILILDEPTSGLDPNQIMEIRSLISDLSREKTVMLSTHIMQEVEAICHKIILINKGNIVADEDTSSLLKGASGELITLKIEFNLPVEKSLLLGIRGIAEVHPLDGNQWVVSGTTNPDVRSEIFNFAVKQKLEVLSLQRQEKTMEQIFHELTSPRKEN